MEKRYDEKDLYAIESSQRLDANESIFFAQELESVKARTYDIVLAELSALGIIPVDSSAGAGAETITYHQYGEVGQAKIIANYSTDLPRVDLVGKKFTSDVKSIGVSYGYSIQDIRAARMAGKPLEQRKASAARRANDQQVNDIAFFGDEEHGLVGLLTHPNIPTYTLPADGTGSSTKFKDKTADQVLRDLNGMVTKMLELTKNVERPDTLLLGHTTHSDLTSRRVGDTQVTILAFFLANNPYIKNVQVVPEFVGVGTGETDICMIYKKSPDKLTLEIPQPFEQFPVQMEGLEYVVPCHSRNGGVIIYFPLSLMKAEDC
jgi:hypothetical protein